MPNILFVIVSYNAKRYMQECIQSIRNKLTPGTYKIAVTDNASTDGIAEWLESQSDILLIRNSSNVGFGPGCNLAVTATRNTEYADYDIFLLNNDTIMTSTAVPRMVETLYSSVDIGAVGCMSSYAGNRQEYPVTFNTTEEYIKYGESLNISKSDATLERTRLNGFAMLIRRNVWDLVGGFDEDFAPGYYEDDALSIEILKRGYRLMLQRNSFIYHVGSASFVKTGTNRLSFEHHELFIRKYNFDILSYVYPCGAIMSQIPFARDSSFAVLYLGCGLGAELKAIHSFYPGAKLFGIETNETLYDIVSKTESVYSSIAAASEQLPSKSINLLILDSNYLTALSQNDKARIAGLCAPDAVELNRLHDYDDFSFDDIFMVSWAKELYSQAIARLLTDRGLINIVTPAEGIARISEMSRINRQHILSIDRNNATIVPYLTAHFSRKPVKGCADKLTMLTDAFMNRYCDSLTPSAEESSLGKSRLNVMVQSDCQNHLDEIAALMDESNLLHDTEMPTDKNSLERLWGSDWNYCGHLTASDIFGDYGIVGFFCYDRRQKKMLRQAISWMVADCRLEDYIRKNIESHGKMVGSASSGKIRILIKGDKSLSPIEEYLIGGSITTEYEDAFTATGGCPNTSLGEDLPTLLYNSKYHIIIFSLLQYDYDSWERDGDGCLGNLFETMDNLYEKAPGNPTIILLLGSEVYYNTADKKSCNLAELHSEINPIISDFAADRDRMRLINITEFISGPADFKGSVDHFSVRVFSDIAERVCLYINEKVDEILSSNR